MLETKKPLTVDDATALVGGSHLFDVNLATREIHHARYVIAFTIDDYDRLSPAERFTTLWLSRLAPQEREAIIAVACDALRQARRRKREPLVVGHFVWGGCWR